MSECLRAALHYAKTFGWKLFPARIEGSKKFSWLAARSSPSGENWGMTNDPDQLQQIFSNPQWQAKCGIGLPTGAVNDLFVIETDTLQGHGVDGLASFKRFESERGRLPQTLMSRSPSGSIHRFFNHPGGRIKSFDSIHGYAGIDCKGDGGMVVIPPSHRADGGYEWLNDEPIADPPGFLVELVKDAPRDSGNGFDPNDPFHKFADEVRPPPSLAELAAMLEVIPNEDLSWDEWNRIGMAIFSVAAGAEGLELFDTFSRKSGKYNERTTKMKWRLYKTSPPTQIGVGTLFYLADEADPSWREEKKEETKSADEHGIYCVTLGELDAITVEPPEWIVPDFIMKDVINGLFGDGGTGKDWLLLQLAISMAVEHPWLGVNVKPGRVIYFNVEDQLKHIRWRQNQIAKHYQIDCSQYDDRLLIAPMVGKDTIMAAYDGRKGIVRPTKVYDSMRKLIGSFKPDLVIVGNRVNIFGINQNDDAQARQCINFLNMLILDFGTTIIMPSHVSKSGMADDSGTSGSVQWSNGVRHRCVLGMAKESEDEAKARNQRVLEVKKTNWTATGTRLGLHWGEPGLFVGDDEGITVIRKPVDLKEREAEIDRDFMELFKRAMELKLRLGPARRSPNNIGKMLSELSGGQRYDNRKGHQLLYAAFERAHKKQLVMLKQYGSPSDQTYQIIFPPTGDNVIRGKFEKPPA